MKKTLRYYQQDVCKEVAKSWGRNERPYASVMTGLGKSLIFAALTNRYVNEGKRVLQLVPRKELVEQNYKEAFEYMDNPSELGIVCGQLGKCQNRKNAVIAMASSFVNKRAISGSFDYVLIDECHRVKFAKENEHVGTYEKIIRSLLRLNPNMKIAGLTGTPYRIDQGMLHEESIKTTPFFTHKVYDTSIYPSIATLIDEGHLAHVEILNSGVSVDLNGVRTSNGDFNPNDAGVKFDAIIDDAIIDLKSQFKSHNIKTAIIYCSTLTNAKHILTQWNDPSTMRIVCGNDTICTPAQRKEAINWIKNGEGCRYIVNVDILAEGFDYRALQCCVLMRATKSAGLMVQMVGRIIRPHEDKKHGILIDYGTNIERLGSIDNINAPKPKKRAGEMPMKVCLIEDCNTVNLLTAKRCKECGAEFISENDDGLYSMRTKAQALAQKEALKIKYPVLRVAYDMAFSKKDSTPMIKMVLLGEYDVVQHTHYVCLDHKGFAGDSAKRFLLSFFKNSKDYYRLGSVGINVENVLKLFNEAPHFFKTIVSVTLSPDGKYQKMVGIEYER